MFWSKNSPDPSERLIDIQLVGEQTREIIINLQQEVKMLHRELDQLRKVTSLMQQEVKMLHRELDQLRNVTFIMAESHEVFTHRLRDFFDNVERRSR